MVFRTLTRLTGTGAHVEDLAQETFLRLYRALPHFRGDATMSTYLYRIVVNIAQDEWKRRRKEREHIALEPTQHEDSDTDRNWLENLPTENPTAEHTRNPEQLLLDASVQQAVDQAMQQLAEIERAILVLYHQEECSYEGISAALDIPINTVRTHLHRGRKRLSELVQRRLNPNASPAQPASNPTRPKHERSGFLMRAAAAVTR
jgi:RNA polymerase sigma-70 factor (ECF subfamily)